MTVRPMFQQRLYSQQVLNNGNNPAVVNSSVTTSRYKNKGNLQLKSQTSSDTFDYSKNDGKISAKDKLINFGKGIIAPITAMFKSPKNLIIGIASIAGISALTVATGGAIAPLLIATGVISGGITFGVSAYRAHNATTDEEAKQAWQGIGMGTSIFVGSVTGAKAAAKGAGIEGAEKMNSFKATWACIKNAPKAVGKSFKSFTSGEFLVNLGIKKPAVKQEEVQIEKPSEPKPEPKTETKVEPKTETNVEPKAEPKPKTETKPEPKQETKVEPKAETKAEPKPEHVVKKQETQTEIKTPQQTLKEAKEKFIAEHKENMPSREDRIKYLKEQGILEDEIKQYGLDSEDNYLDYLWSSNKECQKLELAAKLDTFDKDKMLKFEHAKEILKKNGIEFDVYDEYNLTFEDEILNYLNDNLYNTSKTVDGHASAYSYNSDLRCKDAKGNEGGLWQKILDKGLENIPSTQENITVYRGLNAPEYYKSRCQYIDDIINTKKGCIIPVDKGYPYASFNEDVANRFAQTDKNLILTIKVPKGSKVSCAKHSKQSEMLFPRNSQFKVLQEAQKEGKIYHMIVEYVLPH